MPYAKVKEIYETTEPESEERRLALQKIADEHGGYVYLRSLDCSRMRAAGYDRKAWTYCKADVKWPGRAMTLLPVEYVPISITLTEVKPLDMPKCLLHEMDEED